MLFLSNTDNYFYPSFGHHMKLKTVKMFNSKNVTVKMRIVPDFVYLSYIHQLHKMR